MNNFFTSAGIIWYREVLRYWRTKTRAVSSLVMPFIWLVMFGSGISSSLQFGHGAPADFNYIHFLFPGVLGITVLFTSMFGALSIVRDREFGFLKEIFVAPVPRSSIAFGKILGAATVSTIQGLLMLILLPLVGLELSFGLLVLIPFIFLFSILIASLGILVSAKIKTSESFQMVMQFLTFPMFMLSGALFPLNNLPIWMEVLSKVNPASYGIDAIRQVAFKIFNVPEAIGSLVELHVFGNTLGLVGDLTIIFALGAAFTFLAAWIFAREDM